MDEGERKPILVVSPQWRTRALLAGELGERLERDVLPAPGVEEALRLIKLRGVDPVVVVVDGARGLAAADVERLLEAKRGVPVVLVVSALRRDAFADVAERCAVTLARPVRVEDVARAVVGEVEGLGHGRTESLSH